MKVELRHFLKNASTHRHKFLKKQLEFYQKKLKEIEAIEESENYEKLSKTFNRNTITKQIKFYESMLAKRLLLQVRNTIQEFNEGNLKLTKQFCKENSNSKINEIGELEINNSITKNTDEIINKTIDFYEELYADENACAITQESILKNFDKQISEEHRRHLSQPITKTEILKAIDQLNGDSSPGPDGLSSSLFKHFKSLFATIFEELFETFADDNAIPKTMLSTLMRLLPKDGNLKTLKNWRPISLLNTDMKILAHVVANRLKNVLQHVIHPDQCAYLKGRNMNYANLLLQSLIETSKTKKKNLIICSIDFSKAFDRVDRKYLMKLLEHIGIPANITNIIRQMYTNNTTNILINGFVTKDIQLSRGVKQGCPLSALLFILTVEPLLNEIRKNPTIKGITEDTMNKKLIAYADDINFLCRDTNDIDQIIEIVESFCRGTQFKLNKEKTTIFHTIQPKDGIQDYPTLIKLLGIKYFTNPKEEKTFYEQTISEVCSSAGRFLRTSMSMKTRSTVMKSFSISKIVFHAKFKNMTQRFLAKCQTSLKKAFHCGNKNQISYRILSQNPNNGGLGFPCISTQILTANLMEIHRAIFHNDDEFIKNHLIKALKDKKSCIFRTLKKVGEITGSSKVVMTKNGFILKGREEVRLKAGHKSAYDFLIKAKNNTFVNSRLEKVSEKFGITINTMKRFLRKTTRDRNLRPIERDVLYNFALNLYRDKVFLYNQGFKRDNICFMCHQNIQTFHHLFFDCPRIEIINQLGAKSLKDMFEDSCPNNILLKRSIANIIINSWTDNEKGLKNYLLSSAIS